MINRGRIYKQQRHSQKIQKQSILVKVSRIQLLINYLKLDDVTSRGLNVDKTAATSNENLKHMDSIDSQPKKQEKPKARPIKINT